MAGAILVGDDMMQHAVAVASQVKLTTGPDVGGNALANAKVKVNALGAAIAAHGACASAQLAACGG